MVKISVKSQVSDPENRRSHAVYRFDGAMCEAVNALRRSLLEYVPSYAFVDADIDTNSKTFFRDYLMLRLANLNCLAPNPRSTVERFAELEEAVNRSMYSVVPPAKQVEPGDAWTMLVDVKNTTQDLMYVNTNMAQFFDGGKRVSNPYSQSKPSLIVILKPNEYMKMSAPAKLDIPKRNGVFIGCGRVGYEEVAPGSYELVVNTNNQVSETELLIRACMIIKIKLKTLGDAMVANLQSYTPDEGSMALGLDAEDVSEDPLPDHLVDGRIVLENEGFTMGGLITRLMQMDKSIRVAGYQVTHLLVMNAEIKYVTDGTPITQVIVRVIDAGIKLFENMQRQLEALA